MNNAQVTAFEAMREEIGESISVAVNLNASFDAEAVRGETSPDSQSTDHPGLQATSQTVDFLVLSADVPDDYAPAVGDVIKDANGDRYILTAQGDNRVWRWSDSYKKIMRIHTKPE